MEDMNKPGWKPKFQSEYSMGELDFQRFNNTLTNIDLLSGYVNSSQMPPLELMQNFFAELINLYDDFRPLISTATIVKELDNAIERGVKLKRLWENNQKTGILTSNIKVNEFVDLCRAIKVKLYNIKQVIGLGIVVKRNLSMSEKIKQGIHGRKDFDNLPEA